MKRREFLQRTGAVAGTAFWAPGAAALLGQPASVLPKKMKKVGIQLFSLPLSLERNFRESIELLAQMGYREVEMYGPFPFSVDTVKARWKSLAPALGFSGSGYFGHTAAEVKAILKQHRIKAVATHIDLETLDTRMGQIGEASEVLGFDYAGIPSIPEEKRKSLDDYKRMADLFNKIGANAKREGLKFSYHNHGYGLQEMEGQIPLNLLLERTDPELVFFEMDVYWTTAGGANPIEYLTAYPERYHLMHLKDMQKKVAFSGDGGSPSQWMELFPYMTTAGDGVLDLKGILAAAEKAKVRHYFVEQDMVKSPEIALKRSIDYLNSI